MNEEFMDIDDMLTRKFDARYYDVWMTGFVITINYDGFNGYCSESVCDYYQESKVTVEARYPVWFLRDIKFLCNHG